MKASRNLLPLLRFPEFNGEYTNKRIEAVLARVVDPVHVDAGENYYQIGIRSHGRGIFHKEPVAGVELGSKRVFWVKKDLFVVNIVFAWEQAVAKTTLNEVGMIASHRFPMYQPIPSASELDYLVWFFLTKKGKHLLGLASPGGAGRNKTLGQKEFGRLKLNLPSPEEQKKVADFVSCAEEKIHLLSKKLSLLKKYKKGVMQKLFSQEVRFRDEWGGSYPEWGEKKLGTLTDKVKEKNKSNTVENVFTNSAQNGIVNQREYFNKDIANQDNLEGYYVVNRDDFVYNPRISVSAPVGPIKRNNVGLGVMSPLYTVFRFKDRSCLDFYEQYFKTAAWHRYMKSIANFGARHDRMNIKTSDFMKLPLPYPSNDEMKGIVNFLKAIDEKINAVDRQIEHTMTFKKGLLQRMFI